MLQNTKVGSSATAAAGQREGDDGTCMSGAVRSIPRGFLTLVGLAGWPLPAWCLPVMGNPAFPHESIPAASGVRAGVASGWLHVGRLMRTLGQGGIWPLHPVSCGPWIPSHVFPQPCPSWWPGEACRGPSCSWGPCQTLPSSWWAGTVWVWLFVVEAVGLCRQGGRHREGLGAKACYVSWLSSLDSEKLSWPWKICPGSWARSASCKQ